MRFSRRKKRYRFARKSLQIILGLIRRGQGRSARVTRWRRGEERRETRVRLMDENDGPALAFEVEPFSVIAVSMRL